MLDPELKELLRRNIEIAEDTNRMVRSMRRRAFWGSVAKMIIWGLLIFGIPLFTYYFYLQPYLQGLLDAYGSAKGSLVEVQGFGERIGGLSDMLKNLLGQ